MRALGQATAKLAEKKAALGEVESKLEHATMCLADKTAAFLDAEAKLGQLTVELEQSEVEIERLEGCLDMASKKINEVNGVNVGLEVVIAGANLDAKTRTHDYSALLGNVRALETQLKCAENKRSGLQAKVASLQSALEVAEAMALPDIRAEIQELKIQAVNDKHEIMELRSQISTLMKMRAKDGKQLAALAKARDAGIITAQELAAANNELAEATKRLSNSEARLQKENARMQNDLGFLANEVVSAQELAAAAQERFDEYSVEDKRLAGKLQQAQLKINSLQMGSMHVAAKANYDSAKTYIKNKETRSELAETVVALKLRTKSLENEAERKAEQLAEAQAQLDSQRQHFDGELAVEKAKYARLANKNQTFDAAAFSTVGRQSHRSRSLVEDIHMSYEDEQTGGDVFAASFDEWATMTISDANWAPQPPVTLDLTTTLPREPQFDATATLPKSMRETVREAARSAHALADKENQHANVTAHKPKKQPQSNRSNGRFSGWR